MPEALTGPAWLSPEKGRRLLRGLRPVNKDEVPPGPAPFLDWVRKNPPAESCPPALDAGAWTGIRKVLQALIVYHLEREPKTLRYLATCG